jgi:phage-related protein (TIGR01555 family)
MSEKKRKKKTASPADAPGADFSRGNMTFDAFQNALARLGWGMPNFIEATNYPLTRLTKNYQLMNSLYRSHWVVRRIIDVIPEDMCKNWYQIVSQLPPDVIERITRLERRARIKAKILEGLKWGRLYGGAAAVIMIDGHEDILDQPLDLDMVFPGSFKGLLVVDRWSGIYPGPDLVTDVNDPEFGLPEMYQIVNNATRATVNVHHSRVLRFTGRELPFWEKQAEMYWGASEIEHVFDELRKRDNTSWNIANLVFIANLRVLKMEGIGQLLATANEKVKQDVYNTIQAQNWLMNNFSMYVLGKEDEFDTKQYTFSGLAEIYENFMMDVAGAAEIPVTKLFGRSPAGLNATGESDLQNYYDTIEEKQEAYLRPVLDKLLPVLFMSELGAVPDDLDYRFNPVRRSSDAEKSDLAYKNVEAISKAYNDGVISDRIYLKELRQQSDQTGLFTNITDADIEAADDRPRGMPGETLPDFGILEGVTAGGGTGSLETRQSN